MKFMKQTPTQLQGETDKSQLQEISIPLSHDGQRTRRQVSKDSTAHLPSSLYQLDLADIYRTLHPPGATGNASQVHRELLQKTLRWLINLKRVTVHIVFPSKIHNSNLIMEKHQGNLNSKNSTKELAYVLQ